MVLTSKLDCYSQMSFGKTSSNKIICAHEKDILESGSEVVGHEKDEVILSDGDGFVDADSLTLCKNATCFLYCDSQDTRKNATGFFARVCVSNTYYNVIVTNNHVFSSKEEAKNAIARFHYEGDIPGADARIMPDKIFETNKDLDYTIMGCDDERIMKTFFIRPIPLVDEGTVQTNEEVYIFQHPRGDKKQLSHNAISRVERPFVYYNADTDVGSSGSCVLRRVNNSFKLLAVHCKGSDVLHFNKGVLCSEIINHLTTGSYTPPKALLPPHIAQGSSHTMWTGFNIDQIIGKSSGEESGGKRDGSHLDDTESRSPVKKKLIVDSDLTNYDAEVSESFISNLSKHIITYWKHLGRKLIKNSEIETISRDNINYSDIQDKAYSMLMLWKETSNTPTYAFLKSKLLDMGKNKTVKDLF